MKTEILGDNRQMQILDEKGAGGAHHRYKIVVALSDGKTIDTAADIHFQKGPVQEAGWNGCQIEDLLNICAHRLSCFQNGPFPCRENALALTKVQEAMHWLNHRTYGRMIRGVEGKSEA
jgi:hypothetical protein